MNSIFHIQLFQLTWTLFIHNHNDGAEDTEEARAEKYAKGNTEHEHEVSMGDLEKEIIQDQVWMIINNLEI